MAQAQCRGCPAHAGGFAGIGRQHRAAADVAEGAAAGAGIAEDKERRRVAGIALEHVGAFGALADGMQSQLPHQCARGPVGGLTGQLDAQPRGDAQ